MEKGLRSSLQNSAESFLSSATKLGFKTAKPILKPLIYTINSSSDLSSSLPLSLYHSISQSVASLNHPESGTPEPSKFSVTPPAKRLRRSLRHSKTPVDSETQNHESKINQEKQRLLQKIHVLSHIAFLCVSHPKKAFSPEVLLPAVNLLHDSLNYFESDPALQSEIANLCEEWWKEQLPGKETLISRSLPFLVSRSLTLNKKVDLHRVYVMREAFTLLDFEDESIEDFKLLLIRCVISPLYLKTEEGRRFLAFIFGLSSQLVKEALAMIRSQIPFGRKSMLEAYGDIVFRAWKVAQGNSRDEIENGFLRGLIDGAVHANTGTFAASIRRVLGGFINQRTTDGVDRLLFQLAEPVIFRSLQVANANVRQNALHLLLDMFPLEDPDATKEVNDSLLNKQFFLLEKLIMDDCPDVRVVAVEGSCRILHLFWEIIPSSTITKTIKRILDDMAHDTCNEVRLSVVNGIIYLLGNPQSHELLKVLLPKLGHLILDSALSVRVSVADLLLLLRDIRSFHFNTVVDIDALLSTLANDQPLVAQKITRLLMPSYFPSKEKPEVQCNRCIVLIKRSPMAGARFCEFALSEGASLDSLKQLLKVFISLALSPDHLDEEQVDGLLLAAAHLCTHLVRETSYKAFLKELFSGEKLKCLFAIAKTARAQSSIFNIASTVSPNDIFNLCEECIGLVTNCRGLSQNMDRQAQVRSAHKLILTCDWFDDMFESLSRLLHKTALKSHDQFGTEMPKHNIVRSTKPKKSKSVKIAGKWKQLSRNKTPNSSTFRPTFEEDYSMASGIAWQIKDLLSSENTRKAVLQSKTLELAFSALRVVSEVSIIHCVHCEYMDTSTVLAYTALTLHMAIYNVPVTCTNGSEMGEMIDSSFEKAVVVETLDHLLKCTHKLFTEDTNLTHQKRISNAVKMCLSVFKFIVDAATMGFLLDMEEKCLKFASEYIQFIISTLKQHSDEPLDLRETLNCLKSSCTYATKLLNLVLKVASESSPCLVEVSNLANNLFDFILSVEMYLGSNYASRLVATVKPWLPDLILGVASKNVPEQALGYGMCERYVQPSWPSVIAKIELSEINELSEPNEFSAFKKLMEMMIQSLRGNFAVLDTVGLVFLSGSMYELEKKEFGLVLGFLHFVCVKLARHEEREWEDMNTMLSFLQEVYPRVQSELEDLSSDEDGREKLLGAKALIEPVWMTYIHRSGKSPMMKE